MNIKVKIVMHYSEGKLLCRLCFLELFRIFDSCRDISRQRLHCADVYGRKSEYLLCQYAYTKYNWMMTFEVLIERVVI